MAHFERSWDHLEAILGPSWPILAPSWPILGPSWPILEPPWLILEASWPILEASWSHLGPSWAHLGPSWRPLGPSWRRLGAILAHLGPILAPSWGHLGAQAPPGAKKHCKIRVKVHLEVTTLARDAPEVDFDSYFTMFFAPPEALPAAKVRGVGGWGGKRGSGGGKTREGGAG